MVKLEEERHEEDRRTNVFKFDFFSFNFFGFDPYEIRFFILVPLMWLISHFVKSASSAISATVNSPSVSHICIFVTNEDNKDQKQNVLNLHGLFCNKKNIQWRKPKTHKIIGTIYLFTSFFFYVLLCNMF